MMDMKLYLFTAGYEIDDQSFFTLGRGLGTNRKISSQFFLIEHPQGRLLFDTGLNPAVLSRPDQYEITRHFQPIVTEQDLAPNRLQEIKLKPEQIDLVANSHLHYDHAGGNIYFKHATFLEQFDEIQSAMWPEPYSGLVAENYCRDDFDLPVIFEQLNGDYDVFGDQRVILIRTPGHTRGHQSLIVRLPETGTVILTQDAVYTMENLEKLILSAVCWDQRLMYQSYCRIRELRRHEKAMVIPGHDIDVWEKLLHAPEYYQ